MWTVQNGIFATVHDANGDRIATIAASINEHERARLIAAAPELLEALRLLAEGCSRVMGQDSWGGDYVHVRMAFIEKARAAIAKATGEQS